MSYRSSLKMFYSTCTLVGDGATNVGRDWMASFLYNVISIT